MGGGLYNKYPMSDSRFQWTFTHPNLTDSDSLLGIIPAMDFRFASAYLLPPVYSNDVCYTCFRVWGNPAVKLGVSTSKDVVSAFSDVETGWSVYLKKGELRHGSSVEGPAFFALPQRQEVDICVKLDRVQGTVDFLLLGEVISRSSLSDPAFLSPSPIYFAAALYIGGLQCTCRPLWRYDYWDEKKAALFLYVKGANTIFQRLPEELCRCSLEYL